MTREWRLEIRDCVFIVGPTAAGKSEVGMALAELLGGEIISLDSMAVYRGMDIGTAKPTQEQRQRVPHHLIDIVEPWEEYSVARYLADAAEALEKIRGSGKIPLFVGGTPLYLKAVLRGLFEGPDADWEFRQRWRQLAEDGPPKILHQELMKVDPASAGKLHPHDWRRLIRALEVYYKTGRPLSEWQSQFEKPRREAMGRVIVLDWARDTLYRRIDARVDHMFEQGLVAEVERITSHGKGFGRTASQALGYREVLAHLSGAMNLEETVTAVKTKTRHFAKRQLTWFRHLEECRVLSINEPFHAGEIAQQIARDLDLTPFP
ncbi:MAG: tRNA (adenosine(37)-N6)-dimethylallyltransferase MiaA [Thermogutta sp.]